MTTGLAISLMALVLLVIPVVSGGIAGYLVKRERRFGAIPALAAICCLSLALVVFMVIDATTPPNACGGTGCDHENGFAAMFVAAIAYGPTVLGAWLGRITQRRRSALK